MTAPMDENSRCPRCGADLSGQAVGGHCGNCLLKLALEPPPDGLEPEQPAEPDPANATEGRRIRYFGDYELLEEIARGGMGVVYRARQVSLNRTVALKMILAGNFSSAAMVQRFQTEAEAAARLEHPNIVPIYEIGRHEGQHYFSMRFLEGGTLTEAMAREQFNPRRAGELMVIVARAVHHAHQRGILHRDLKPGNILLNGNGEPHVADFGLAKLLESDSELTLSAATLGTPSYMAPEQASGQLKQATTATDIYSLGAILYELLTGRRPFRGATALETMRQVVETAPIRPRLLNPQLDADIETICLKCLEKEADRRYTSGAALAEDLQRWLAGMPIRARPATGAERTVKWARREPMKAALVLVSCIAVAALTGIALTRLAFRAEQKERKKTVAALEEMEKQRKATAELQHLREEDAEVRLELGRIDAWLNAEEYDYALAYLAMVARRFPSNVQVAERVLSELSGRQLPWRLFGPIKADRWTLSPDEKTVAEISGRVPQLWDLSTGAVIPWKGGYYEPIRMLSFSSDGEGHATLHSNNDVRVWTGAMGEQIAQAISLPTPPEAIHLLTGGKQLLALQYSDWSLWDLASRQMVKTGRGNRAELMRVSPDGQLLAVVPHNVGGQLTFIPLGSNAFTNVPGPLPGIHAIEFSRAGNLFAAAHQGAITILEMPSLKTICTLKINFRVRLMRFLPAATGLIVTDENGSAQLWNLEPQQVHFNASLGYVNDLQFSPDGLRFTTAGNDGKVRVFRSDTGRPISHPLEHRERVIRAWFSHNGERLFTVTTESVFRVWHAGTLPPAGDGRTQPPVVFRTVPHIENRTNRTTGVAPVRAPGLLKLWGDQPVPLPIPDWVAPFLETVSGLKLNSDGRGEFVSQSEIPTLRERLESISKPDVYERFARWGITPSSLRPSTVPAPDSTVSRLPAENTLETVREVLWHSPTNGVALARLAQHLFRARADGARDYEFLSTRALHLAPQEPEVWLIRIEILRRSGRLSEAVASASQAAGHFPNELAIREEKASLLESAGQLEEALRELEAIKELAAAEKSAAPGMLGRFYLSRARLLHGLNRTEEAQADERNARVLLPRSTDWPARGGNDPARNMYSPERDLPDEFDPGQMIRGTERIDLATTRNVRWAAKLGSQTFGAVAIAGGKVFVGTNNDSPRDPRHLGDRSILMCLDEASGAFRWQLVVPKLKAGKVNDWENLGIISTPAVVENRLYVVTTRAEVLCLDVEGMANGNDGPFLREADYVLQDATATEVPPGPQDADIIWRYDLIDELGVFPHNSSASSPLIIGDILYVASGNGHDWTHSNVPSPASPTFVALDRHTGKFLAEDDVQIGPRILHGSWGSPSAGVVNGRQLIFFGGPDGWCYAFDAMPSKGNEVDLLKTVWKADCNPAEYKSRNNKPILYPAAEGISEIIATPVFYKNRVYVATGQDPEHGEGNGNLLCLDATRIGDITDTGIIWRNKKVNRSLSTVSIDPETALLFVSDFSGFVHCIDAETGKTFWTHDLKAHVWPGGTLVADGKVYIGDEDGDFVVLSATKAKRLISECNVNAPIYSTPVAANGVLYIQSTMHLFALQDLTLRSTGK